MRCKLGLLLGLSLVTTACATMSGPKPTPTPETSDKVPTTVAQAVSQAVTCPAPPKPAFCAAFQVVHYSRSGDTLETIKETKANNAVWHSLCDGPK